MAVASGAERIAETRQPRAFASRRILPEYARGPTKIPATRDSPVRGFPFRAKRTLTPAALSAATKAAPEIVSRFPAWGSKYATRFGAGPRRGRLHEAQAENSGAASCR